MNKIFLCVAVCFLFSGGMLRAEPLPKFNQLILRQIEEMPQGGGYATTSMATSQLCVSTKWKDGMLSINPHAAVPSYCSGATYLIFLKVIAALQSSGELKLSEPVLKALMVNRQPDGEGIWGRWNANGPGTACLFHDLQLGKNFTHYEEAIPGDFMKIFWNDAVGKYERGHLVVYLGESDIGGEPHIKFWSSNQPAGYGVKAVPKKKIVRVIFSRLQNPENLSRIPGLPRKDAYLAGLLTKVSSFKEAAEQSGIAD